MQGSYLHWTQTARVTITHQTIICWKIAPTLEYPWQSKLLCRCTTEPLNIGRGADMKINCCRLHMGFFQTFNCSKLARTLSGRKLQPQKICRDGKERCSKQLTLQSWHFSFRTWMTKYALMFLFLKTYTKAKTTCNCKKSQQTPSKYLPVTVSLDFQSPFEKTAPVLT